MKVQTYINPSRKLSDCNLKRKLENCVCFAEEAEEDLKHWQEANKVTFSSMGIEKGDRPHPWYIPAFESYSFHNLSIMQMVQTGVLTDPIDGIWQICHN